jgi:hypothetical protein
MKRLLIIVVILLPVLSGCKKDETARTSGIDTIDNTVYMSDTYYSLGFSFSQAKKFSNLNNPWPDIVLYVNSDAQENRLTFQTENFKSSFYKLGDYSDATAASAAFSNLKTVSVTQWSEMADPVKENQVWIYRSQSECYAKIRIITATIDNSKTPVYGKCTFEWIYQPDGSSTFPGK